MEKKSLLDLGNVLPLVVEGYEAKDFSFKPWRLAEEKKIGQIKNKHKRIGTFVKEVFNVMLDTLCGTKWENFSPEVRDAILSKMPYGNVFYLYIYLRYEALGATLNFGDIKCPYCGFIIKQFKADLNTLDVRVPEKSDGSTAKYLLKKPFQLGEVKVIGLNIGHTPWSCMEKIDATDAQNAGLVKEKILSQSIISAVTDLGDANLDKLLVVNNLSKIDLEGISNVIDEHNGGPVLGLDIECSSCGEISQKPLNWSPDYFFMSSSL